MKIVIRADASSSLGYGHFSRCLNLAKEFKKRFNCEIYFLTINFNNYYIKTIKKNKFKVYLLSSKKIKDQKSDAKYSNKFFIKYNPDLLILDNYNLNIYWEKLVKKNIKKLFVIDDLKRIHDCDFFLDQNFSSLFKKSTFNKLLKKKTIKLIGPQFSLIDSKYNLLKIKKKKKAKKKTILINFGSYDINNLTCKILKYIFSLKNSNFNIKIVIENKFKFYEILKKICKNKKSIKIYSNLKSLHQVTLHSDICFGSGGISNIERMCLGKVNYVITTSHNQIENCEALDKKKYINYIGHYSKINNKIFKKKLSNININSKNKIIQNRAFKLIDGNGAGRVAHYLGKKIKNGK